ncbi:chaperonin 10-like protein, partial [Mycena leptocephala]
MGGSGGLKSASALRTTGKFGPGPKASKVGNKFPWSSKAYSKAFLSLKPLPSTTPGTTILSWRRTIPFAELQDHEVLLKVAACGVCHTDVTILSGVGLDTRQYVLGHEASGVPVNERVYGPTGQIIFVLIYDGCMKSGVTPPVATVPAVIGVGKDGAYAQYVITDAASLVPVPDGVPAEVAAVASDAGVTAYHAVENARRSRRRQSVDFRNRRPRPSRAPSMPAARKLALELGATEAFDLIELQTKTAAGFTVDTTIDFIANSQ